MKTQRTESMFLPSELEFFGAVATITAGVWWLHASPFDMAAICALVGMIRNARR